MEDLRDTIEGFDERARILNVAITRDGWPPQRAVAGFDLPRDTPFEGLWNVGDAVKEYANGGTTACAETAQLVVEEIAAAFSLTNSSQCPATVIWPHSSSCGELRHPTTSIIPWSPLSG